MTEAEWMTCADPKPMIDFLRQKVTSERKLRLFSCACHYHVWDRIVDESVRAVIQLSERFADRQISYDELNAAYLDMSAEVYDAPEEYDWDNALLDAWGAADLSSDPESEAGFQAALLRDIFGNPFRTHAIDQRCLGSAVVSLGDKIYSQREFDKMQELADALEQSGCTDSDILAHCRGHGPHVRGCWVIDRLLGKT
jgi:hypothetical protein